MKFMNTITKVGSALALFTIIHAPTHAVPTITVFTDAVAWKSTVGDFVVEDFETSNLIDPTTLADPLQNITGNGFPPTITLQQTNPGNRVLWDGVDQNQFDDTTFTFNPGVYGMAGTWDLGTLNGQVGGPGTGITVRTSSGLYTVGAIAPDTINGFWGFTIDEAIIDVTLSETAFPIGIERYTLDDLHMALNLPEPSILALLGLGLVGIGVISRRKRKA